jgi:hypothetical protein
LRHNSLREREKYQTSPVSSVLDKASAFMWASIKTAPLAWSTVMAVISPSALKRGVSRVPSSRSSLVPAGAKGVDGVHMRRSLGDWLRESSHFWRFA